MRKFEGDEEGKWIEREGKVEAERWKGKEMRKEKGGWKEKEKWEKRKRGKNIIVK